MARQISRVIKKRLVRITGERRIRADADGTVQAERPKAQATVLGEQDGVLMIQVVCPCGEEIQLRCELDEPMPAAMAAGATG